MSKRGEILVTLEKQTSRLKQPINFVIQLWTGCKLAFFANYSEAITKSIYTCFTNYGCWGMLGDVESDGMVWDAPDKQTIWAALKVNNFQL